MPITSPCTLTRAPPELPGLMGASVWIALNRNGPTLPDVSPGSCTVAQAHSQHLVSLSVRQAARERFRLPHPIAHLQLAQVPEPRDGQVGRLDLQHSQIRPGV